MTVLLAATPLLVSTGLLLILRQSAARAGLAGLFVAAAIAAVVASYRLLPQGLLEAVVRGGLTTLIVAYVLLGGVMLYQVLREGGALDTLSAATVQAVPDPTHRLLTLVFGVSVFFESATGFGIGIVVCAPLFVALGYGPQRAAFLALLGQCAVPWGALSIGTTLGSELSGMPVAILGTWGALLSAPFILLCGAVAMLVADQWKPWPRRLLQLLCYGGVLTAALWAASAWVGVELAGVLAGLAVTALGLASSLLGGWTGAAREPGRTRLWQALLPVAVLVTGLLLTRLWPAAAEWTRSLLVLSVPQHDYALPLVHHPGFWMLAGAVAGILALRVPGGRVAQAALAGLRQWWVATLAVAGFLCMAQVMFDAGMIDALSRTVTGALAGDYLLLVPFVGALGGFLTASNAGANAMFMQFQASASQALALPLDATASAQNAAAANATLASPGRVVLAAAVTNCSGQEDRLMRPALLVALAGTAAISAILWVIA